MSHLLLWSCGPVQDFIASARKGRDLWFGSWLLSEVASAAAVHLTRAGATLLLPAPRSAEELQRPDFSVPNRVLAQVPDQKNADLVRLAEEASAAARHRLQAIAEATLVQLDREGHGDQYDRTEALAQVADLLETAWAATPCTGHDPTDRARVEALLAARKSARPFAAPSFAAWDVPKSSLDGERECVTRKGAGLRLGLNRQERLCGIGLVKRLGHRALPPEQRNQVPSVSHAAALTWLRPAIDHDRSALEQALARFRGTLLASGHFASLDQPTHAASPLFGTLEPHALYSNRLHELWDPPTSPEGPRRLPRAPDVPDDLLHTQQRALAELANAFGLPRTPNPYYAILLADGDRLGKLLRQLTHPQLQQVSRALTNFVEQVRKEVFSPEALRGTCVYAGGDDVLAIVPVDQVLLVGKLLSHSFQMAFEPLKSFIPEPPTLSAGICVAHHLVPLREVLQGARAAERIAKDVHGRDAWAVRLAKRSGGTTDCGGKWSELGEMEDLVRLSGPSGALPRGLAGDLVAIRDQLQGEDRGPHRAHIERCELVRVLRQKGLHHPPPDPNPTDEHEPHPMVLLHYHTKNPDLGRLADRLVVARALSGMGGGA